MLKVRDRSRDEIEPHKLFKEAVLETLLVVYTKAKNPNPELMEHIRGVKNLSQFHDTMQAGLKEVNNPELAQIKEAAHISGELLALQKTVDQSIKEVIQLFGSGETAKDQPGYLSAFPLSDGKALSAEWLQSHPYETPNPEQKLPKGRSIGARLANLWKR